ncbi:SocA family protein [Tenacibaculum sp. 1B UA]|uniref:Panacea domain-containing protein n=1 Tax=Tenacibaculum sp. 1B UA TaxID=2922252 RepID=UPI002A24C4D4|nr:Panacea domain-containing protein [Tenacibaculum sp. 1B UA]MDX8552182.1 SocA family protein [Tenacibaculum sp. 1B UA]
MLKEDKTLITLHSILYILNRLGGKSDFLKVFKILYFAEMKHLSKYGRMFTENTYNALPNGPVPDYAYEALRFLRGDEGFLDFEDAQIFKENLRVYNNYHITSLSSEDLDELSISEIKCLDESINDNKDLSFGQLSEKSHGPAWSSVPVLFNEIPFEEIAKEANMNEDMIKYALEQKDLKRASFL